MGEFLGRILGRRYTCECGAVYELTANDDALTPDIERAACIKCTGRLIIPRHRTYKYARTVDR